MKDIKDWIRKHEGFIVYDDEFNKCLNDLALFSWYVNQPIHVKNALIHMCFDLGIKRLLSFKKMIAALKDKDYAKACIEILDSKWSTENWERAKDIALMMRQA